MFKILLICLLITSALGLVARHDKDPTRYTICGGDRGYTEEDSLGAAQCFENKIVTSDFFFMEREDCIFAHVNTTIVRLCNGSYRDRHINRAEVGRGFEQLIKDYGLEGGFTGVHVVNNLTFAAYGVFGSINLKAPSGVNPPDVPGGGSKHKRPVLRADENGVIGCRNARSRPRRSVGAVTVGVEVTQGTEVSIINSFSIGVDEVFKEVVGAGLSYSWSLTETKSESTTDVTTDGDTAHLSAEEKEQTWARWLYFARLIKSCGTVSSSERKSTISGCGTSVCPPAIEECGDQEERSENVCILSPLLDDKGANVLVWARRLESRDGKPLSMDRQSPSYKNACNQSADPDQDEENECANDNPNRRREVDFAAMKREYERSLARIAYSV